jgi:general secretion pathway protein G
MMENHSDTLGHHQWHVGRSALIGWIKALLMLVMLVTLGSISLGTPATKSNIGAAKIQVQQLESAIDTYSATTQQSPSGLIDLLDPPRDPKARKGWAGPYLKRNKESLIDPWGNPYQYAVHGYMNQNSYDLWSLGTDGRNGTEDDIGNWK